MANRDGISNKKFAALIPPAAAVTDNTATVSNIIDTLGYDSVSFILITGTLSDADATFAVTCDEGDVSNLSDASAVAAADLVTQTSGTAALTAAGYTFADDGEVRCFGYVGGKRYVRVTVTPSANTGNHFVAGIAMLGPGRSPAVNQLSPGQS